MRNLEFPLGVKVTAFFLLLANALLSTTSSDDLLFTAAKMAVLLVSVGALYIVARISYNWSLAGRVMKLAANSGYRGPSLRLTRKHTDIDRLQPGQLTCLHSSTVKILPNALALVIPRAQAHIFSYVAWVDSNGIRIASVGPTVPDLERARSNEPNAWTAQFTTHVFTPETCPHDKQ